MFSGARIVSGVIFAAIVSSARKSHTGLQPTDLLELPQLYHSFGREEIAALLYNLAGLGLLPSEVYRILLRSEALHRPPSKHGFPHWLPHGPSYFTLSLCVLFCLRLCGGCVHTMCLCDVFCFKSEISPEK